MNTEAKPAPTPEQIDALAFELHTMGVHVPPRDTAFFQAVVTKWLASWMDPERPRSAGDESLCAVCGEHANEHGAIPHEFVPKPAPAVIGADCVAVPRALVERAMESCRINHDGLAWEVLLWMLDPASFAGERLQRVTKFLDELRTARSAAIAAKGEA